ncbi:unnamed protein product, partial [Amoebophrya sp. A120]
GDKNAKIFGSQPDGYYDKNRQSLGAAWRPGTAIRPVLAGVFPLRATTTSPTPPLLATWEMDCCSSSMRICFRNNSKIRMSGCSSSSTRLPVLVDNTQLQAALVDKDSNSKPNFNRIIMQIKTSRN